jgi:hypothetical protein
MKRFVQGQERSQGTLFPACLDDYVSEDNPVRVIEVFVEELDLAVLGFRGVMPHATGRPPTILPPCSRSISTAISTASRPVAVSNRRPSAISS